MKNNTENSFFDIKSMLSQLNHNNNVEKVEDTLSGIDFNDLRDEGVLILARVVFEGHLKAIRFLLEKGANPNLESSRLHYYKGPAMLFVLQNNNSVIKDKIEILKVLIDYGSDINANVSWYDKEKKATLTGNYIEYGIALGIEYYKIIYSDNYDVESKKSSKKDLEGLQAVLSFINQYGIKLNLETTRQLDDFLSIKPYEHKQVNPEDYFKEALGKLTVASRVNDLPNAAKEVCYEYLSNANFVPTKEWARLVRQLVNVSLTFEEVSKETYGKSITIDLDEGGLCQSWEEYNWFIELIEILSNRETLKNPEWDKLVILIIEEYKKYDGQIQDEIKMLFKESWVQSHKSFQKLKETANNLKLRI